jgi:hypothetical protein
MGMAWADLLPYQALEWGAPARQQTPPPGPSSPEPSGYVQHLSAGGWPDVTESGIRRDAKADRVAARALDNRTTLNTSPLADRDGYTGAIPPGAGVYLPGIAQPSDVADKRSAQPAPAGSTRKRWWQRG